MSPPVFNYSVPLAKEHLLSFHRIEIMQLCLDFLKLRTSLSWGPQFSGIYQQFLLCVPQILYLLGEVIEVELSLGLIVERLPTLERVLFLHGGEGLPLLQG